MEKALLPVNGTQISDHAADEFIHLYRSEPLPTELHLLNVQLSSPILFRPRTWYEARGSQLEAGLVYPHSAKENLNQAGIPYTCHVLVGDSAQTIPAFCKELQYRRIVMRSRALRGWVNRQSGSPSSRVVQQADVPVRVIPENPHLPDPCTRYAELEHRPSFGHYRF